MAWNPPSTFAVGEILASAKNNQIRESLLYLKGQDGPIAYDAALLGPTILDSSQTCRARLWRATGVGATPVVIIPDGAGDVTLSVSLHGFCRRVSTGNPAAANAASRPGGAIMTIFNDGTNICEVWCLASGEVNVRRSGGTDTFEVGLWLIWS